MGGVGRCVFSATAAYLGRIDSATRVAFWADDPQRVDFDPARLIAVDLARAPSAAMAGKIPWTAVEVDDCMTGPAGELAGTTIGPRWPEIQIAGVALLEAGFVARLPDILRPACPPRGEGGRVYEYMTALYWPDTGDPRAGIRYSGHHAEIIECRGSLAYLKVYATGTSEAGDAAPTEMWIDLESPKQCDAGPLQLTTLRPGAPEPSGALFLVSGHLDR